MRAPSKKRLISELGLSPEQADTARALVYREIRTDDPRFKETNAWLEKCYHRPSYPERLMSCLDEVIRGDGVEVIEEDGRLLALYVNTGDTYSPTLLYNLKTRAVSLTTWGDFAERYA
jgi:hypothetical protein